MYWLVRWNYEYKKYKNDINSCSMYQLVMWKNHVPKFKTGDITFKNLKCPVWSLTTLSSASLVMVKIGNIHCVGFTFCPLQ